MNKIGTIVLAVVLTGAAHAQNISLNWVRTENYSNENANSIIDIDHGTNDVVSAVTNIWIDINNSIHANALNRRDASGQMLYDTLFNDSSYLNYRVRAFYPKNGELYYCLNYQASDLIYEKINTAGQLVWQTQIPRSTTFFNFDRNLKGNSWCVDDTLNNRMIWTYEQWNPSFTTKSIGLLATDNVTGAITILDTVSYSNTTYYPFSGEVTRDANNHIYFSGTDDSSNLHIWQLVNGQLINEATIDSTGFRNFAQSIRFAGNTMFVTEQIEITTGVFTSKLLIYAIDNAGHLSLISQQTFPGTTQQYIIGMDAFRNNCYVYTSCYQNFPNTTGTPVIWKYDNTGTLINTFTLNSFAGKSVIDISVTDHALYCCMLGNGTNTLEIFNPNTGANTGSYNLMQQFSNTGNDGVQQIEAQSSTPNSDVIYAAGNKWINSLLFARLAKYSCEFVKNGIEEQEASSFLSVYPNPAGNTVTINYRTGKKYMIEITDAQGRLVRSCLAEGGQQQIDLSRLSSGVYTIRVQDTERTMVQRFVKE